MKFILCLILLASSMAFSQSTIAVDGNAFAYSANTGWINFRSSTADGIVATGAWLSGHAYAANVGWISFGDATPANGYAYANNSASDFGVNHDGAGNLSGYAYGANIGWINFGWTSSTDPLRPRIDLSTGYFSGYAYGANVGWINLGSGYLRTNILAYPDSDGDGIADAWEMQWFGNLTEADMTTDNDHDGAGDVAEFIAGTRPKDINSSFKITQQTYNAGMTEVTLTFAQTTPTRHYRIEHSEDLQPPWSVFTPANFAPDSGDSTTRTVSFSNSSRRFFRVVATLPLHP